MVTLVLLIFSDNTRHLTRHIQYRARCIDYINNTIKYLKILLSNTNIEIEKAIACPEKVRDRLNHLIG